MPRASFALTSAPASIRVFTTDTGPSADASTSGVNEPSAIVPFLTLTARRRRDRVDVGAFLEQQLHRVKISFSRGIHQRRDAHERRRG